MCEMLNGFLSSNRGRQAFSFELLSNKLGAHLLGSFLCRALVLATNCQYT